MRELKTTVSRLIRRSVVVFFVFFVNVCFASDKPSLTLDAFLSSQCPNCQEAFHFLKKYQTEHPTATITYYWIDQDQSALAQFHKKLVAQHELNFQVPAFFFCDTHWVGFSSINPTPLSDALAYCEKESKTGRSIEEIRQHIQEHMYLSQYFLLLQYKTPDHLLIPGMVLFEFIYPSALFVLLGFFAVMGLEKNIANYLKQACAYLTGVAICLLFILIAPNILKNSNALMLLRILSVFVGMSLLAYGVYFKRLSHQLKFCIAGLGGLVIQAYQQPEGYGQKLFSFWVQSSPHTPLFVMLSALFYTLIYLSPFFLWALISSYYFKNHYQERPIRPGFFYGYRVCLGIEGLLLLFVPSALSSFRLSLICAIIGILSCLLFVKRGLPHEHT